MDEKRSVVTCRSDIFYSVVLTRDGTFFIGGNKMYLTKEYCKGKKARLSHFDEDLKCDNRAEKFDEEFYKELSQKERKEDLNEVLRPVLNRIDKERYQKGLGIIRMLPQSIKSDVADARVLLLGYASEQVVKKLKGYCKELRAECKSLLEKASEETQKAEKHLKKRLHIDCFSGMDFRSFYKRDKDLIIDLSEGVLEIKNAEILECENIGYENEWLENSKIAKAEVCYKEGKFILGLIIESQETSVSFEYWSLTVKGEDIIEDPENDFSAWKYFHWNGKCPDDLPVEREFETEE